MDMQVKGRKTGNGTCSVADNVAWGRTEGLLQMDDWFSDELSKNGSAARRPNFLCVGKIVFQEK